MSQNIKTIPTSEYAEVVKTVQMYVDGLIAGDNKTLEKAFNKEAIMYGLTAQGELLGGHFSKLYTYVDQHGKAPHMQVRPDILGITPTTAVVKVELEKDAAGLDYTDFHTLIKMDGKWSIIAKTFHTYAL